MVDQYYCGCCNIIKIEELMKRSCLEKYCKSLVLLLSSVLLLCFISAEPA